MMTTSISTTFAAHRTTGFREQIFNSSRQVHSHTVFKICPQPPSPGPSSRRERNFVHENRMHPTCSRDCPWNEIYIAAIMTMLCIVFCTETCSDGRQTKRDEGAHRAVSRVPRRRIPSKSVGYGENGNRS